MTFGMHKKTVAAIQLPKFHKNWNHFVTRYMHNSGHVILKYV